MEIFKYMQKYRETYNELPHTQHPAWSPIHYVILFHLYLHPLSYTDLLHCKVSTRYHVNSIINIFVWDSRYKDRQWKEQKSCVVGSLQSKWTQPTAIQHQGRTFLFLSQSAWLRPAESQQSGAFLQANRNDWIY